MAKQTTKRDLAPRKKVMGVALSDHNQLAQEVLKKFRVVFGSIKKHFREIEKQSGVSGVQVWTLWEISRTPGMRVTELANALSVHQSTMSNLLDKIEEEGLIRKERTKGDQRVVRLYLTEQGHEIIKLAPKPMSGVLPDALQKLPFETLHSLSKDMDMLLTLMPAKDASAASKTLSEI
jgi:DNA-binding MarR family transcriptional regulator